ncbi:MAG TPA: SAM-dependent methyltransferase [Acidimicrobiales bacterium]
MTGATSRATSGGPSGNGGPSDTVDVTDGRDGADGDWWEEPIEIDRTVPHIARMYDYLLGGRVNFAADRQLARRVTAALPGGLEQARANVRVNREFLIWTVRRLAGEVGVRQFLDIGTGLPTEENVHQVAQAEDPTCRIVYVDPDPTVLALSRRLLQGSSQGAIAYLEADLREPDVILRRAAATLDFSEPVGLMLLGVLHYVLDSEGPYGIVARLAEALAPGSHVVVSHLASDVDPEVMAEMVRRHNEAGSVELATVRSRAEVVRFFAGLELLEPGVVPLDEWLHRVRGAGGAVDARAGVVVGRAVGRAGAATGGAADGPPGGEADRAVGGGGGGRPRRSHRPVPIHGGMARKP